VPLSHGVIVLKLASAFPLLSLRLCGKNAFVLHFQRLTPAHPLRRHINDTAADTSETFATVVPFQRHQPNQSRHKNVNSAAASLTLACHFGG